MKRTIRISALVFAIFLLTGCASSSEPQREKKPKSSAETTAFVETTLPEETTVPEETTAPEETTVATEPASTAVFDAVYADLCRLLDTGDQDQAYTYTSTGILEVVLPQDTKEERYGSISYALEDINHDGNQELIVLDAMDNARILAIYANEDGQPIMTHEGWYRSRLYLLSDGILYSEGYGGAAYSIFEADGQRWFTYPKDNNGTSVGYYYAADGSYDPATAQEITADEYNAKQVEFTQKIVTFSVNNFC